MAGRSPKPRRRTTRRTAAAPLSRAELNQLRRLVLDNAAAIDKLRDEQQIQFRRMAQLQAELDALKQSLDRARHLP
jgi:hypothetical protein